MLGENATSLTQSVCSIKSSDSAALKPASPKLCGTSGMGEHSHGRTSRPCSIPLCALHARAMRPCVCVWKAWCCVSESGVERSSAGAGNGVCRKARQARHGKWTMCAACDAKDGCPRGDT